MEKISTYIPNRPIITLGTGQFLQVLVEYVSDRPRLEHIECELIKPF
jgi:hypothetical protein